MTIVHNLGRRKADYVASRWLSAPLPSTEHSNRLGNQCTPRSIAVKAALGPLLFRLKFPRFRAVPPLRGHHGGDEPFERDGAASAASE